MGIEISHHPEVDQAHLTLNCRGRLLTLDQPRVMGILNLTPDSFSDGGRYQQWDAALTQVERLLTEGADLIDVGGYSSRPGATDIPAEEELQRIESIVAEILRRFPEALVSVDTFRARVARHVLEMGVHMVNDISAGQFEPEILSVVAEYPVPYVMMHIQGTPQTMQLNPQYDDVVEEVCTYFVDRIGAARQAGIRDLILDPGFGFGKTLAHNYALMQSLGTFRSFGLPILVGISRKSMLTRRLGIPRTETLPAASALHLWSMVQGARLLRVHEVKPAVEVVQIFQTLTYGVV